MPTKAKTIREIPFASIERRFQLGAYWFGARYCPAVTRDGGQYRIRIVAQTTVSSGGSKTTWDYFECDLDGLVTTAPRGYAKDYKPGRIVGLDEALVKYAPEDPSALRLNFGGL